MNEHKYVIGVGQEVIAKDVPGVYVMIIARAILQEYHLDPNISVIIARQQGC